MQNTFFYFFLLLTLAFLSACSPSPSAPGILQESECLTPAMKANLSLDTVRLQPLSREIPLTGKVEYNPDHVIQFHNLVSGLITNTYFTLGQAVKKGQLLAEIKSLELIEMLANEKKLQTELQLARRNLANKRQLFEDQFATELAVREAENEVELLELALDHSHTQLEFYQASKVKGVFQIKAPSSGIVVQKNIVPGMQVPADGESLFTISDRNEVWIMANVYAKNIRSVKKDMEAFVKTSAYPEEVFVGKINLLAQVFDEEERVVKARIEMSNPENKLLPGMYVEVFLEENASESALAIPTNALIFDDNQHFVLRYKSDCEVAPIPVSILSERQGTTFVSGNLQAGNLLINKNHLLFFTSLKEQKNKPTK